MEYLKNECAKTKIEVDRLIERFGRYIPKIIGYKNYINTISDNFFIFIENIELQKRFQEIKTNKILSYDSNEKTIDKMQHLITDLNQVDKYDTDNVENILLNIIKDKINMCIGVKDDAIINLKEYSDLHEQMSSFSKEEQISYVDEIRLLNQLKKELKKEENYKSIDTSEVIDDTMKEYVNYIYDASTINKTVTKYFGLDANSSLKGDYFYIAPKLDKTTIKIKSDLIANCLYIRYRYLQKYFLKRIKEIKYKEISVYAENIGIFFDEDSYLNKLKNIVFADEDVEIFKKKLLDENYYLGFIYNLFNKYQILIMLKDQILYHKGIEELANTLIQKRTNIISLIDISILYIYIDFYIILLL